MEQTKKNPKPLWRDALAGTKKIYPSSLILIFYYTLMIALCFALGIYYSSSLVLTFPLILLPFLLSFQINESALAAGRKLDGVSFYRYYPSFFSRDFYGSYRVFRSFFLSLLFSMVVTTVVAAIYSSSRSAADPVFYSGMNEILTAVSAYDSDAITAIVNRTDLGIGDLFFLIAIVEGSSFFLMFYHLIARNGILPYLHLAMKGGQSRFVNGIYIGTTRERKTGTNYRNDYYGSLWPLYLIGVLGFAFGGYLASLAFGDFSSANLGTRNGGIVAVGAAAGGLFFLTFFLPYYFEVMRLLSEKYKGAFMDYSVRLAKNTLEQLKLNQTMNAQQYEKIRKSLEDAEKARKDGDSGDDANGSSDDGQNDDDSYYQDDDQANDPIDNTPSSRRDTSDYGRSDSGVSGSDDDKKKK